MRLETKRVKIQVSLAEILAIVYALAKIFGLVLH